MSYDDLFCQGQKIRNLEEMVQLLENLFQTFQVIFI